VRASSLERVYSSSQNPEENEKGGEGGPRKKGPSQRPPPPLGGDAPKTCSTKWRNGALMRKGKEETREWGKRRGVSGKD